MDIRLFKTEQLKPHENISQKRFERLLKKIFKEGIFNVPIIVDAKTNVILDGHHRHQVARALGIKEVPCLCVDYAEDPSVTVHPRRKGLDVSKRDVIQHGVAGELYPYKTTRHAFDEELPCCEPQDVPKESPIKSKKMYTATFIRKESIASRTTAFYFKKPEGYEFKAGQYTFLLPGFGEDVPGRYLSIASAPHEKELMFLVRMRNTPFKNLLTSLKEGDEVSMEEAGNSFVLPEEETQDVVCIAGGVGVAPFLSMIQEEKYLHSKRNITLFSSNRTPRTSVYSSHLEELQSTLPSFTYVPVMTRLSTTSKKWKGEVGHITEGQIIRYVKNARQSMFYIAGSQPMVVAVKTLLIGMGIKEDKIKVEHFCGYEGYLCTHCLQRYTRSLIAS